MSKKYNFSDDDISKMISMYQNFEPIYKISSIFNVDDSVVKNRLEKNGIKIPKGSPYSYNYWVARGMDENLINNHLKKIKPCYIEYWLNKGYSENDAKLQIEGQKLTSLKGCIARFGEERGNEVWEKRKDMRSDAAKLGSANIIYWINMGYTEEEAKIKLKERQTTFSLDKCIQKYGEEEGKKIFTERQNKWQNSLNKNGNIRNGFSKISQELFYNILNHYDIKDREYIYFATKNNEYGINKKDGGIYLYDFTDVKNKKIIEFNGDLYHANPKKFISEDNPHPFRKTIKAKDIWEKDNIKIETAKSNGFDVLVVWDSEYRWGKKENIIKKCVDFIKK